MHLAVVSRETYYKRYAYVYLSVGVRVGSSVHIMQTSDCWYPNIYEALDAAALTRPDDIPDSHNGPFLSLIEKDIRPPARSLIQWFMSLFK